MLFFSTSQPEHSMTIHSLLFVTMIIVCVISSVGFIGCGLVLRRTYHDNKRFAEGNASVIAWEYPGSEAMGIKPGMHNVVLFSEGPFWGNDTSMPTTKAPFKVQVGRLLDIWFFTISGLDYFKEGTAQNPNSFVLSTYLGKKPVSFRFQTNSSTSVKVTSTLEEQHMKPDVICLPHFWQKYFGWWA